MQPDIVLRLRLRTPDEGGRQQPISVNPGMHFGCPLLIDGEYFDCRWLLDGRVLELGHEHQVAVKFLFFAPVAPLLTVEKTIQMWDGRVIADGVIADVCKNRK